MPDFQLTLPIITTGVLIFFARIVDVALGTFRTISIVQGRSWMAFWLGFCEVIIWLIVVSAVIQRIEKVPLLGVFYAFGFAAGNMVGIQLEKWLAFGHIILKVIVKDKFREITDRVREAGFAVTIFQGEGMSGPVAELYIVCLRKDLQMILKLVRAIDPTAFYVTAQAGLISGVYRPIMQPVTGWRAIFKKK